MIVEEPEDDDKTSEVKSDVALKREKVIPSRIPNQQVYVPPARRHGKPKELNKPQNVDPSREHTSNHGSQAQRGKNSCVDKGKDSCTFAASASSSGSQSRHYRPVDSSLPKECVSNITADSIVERKIEHVFRVSTPESHELQLTSQSVSLAAGSSASRPARVHSAIKQEQQHKESKNTDDNTLTPPRNTPSKDPRPDFVDKVGDNRLKASCVIVRDLPSSLLEQADLEAEMSPFLKIGGVLKRVPLSSCVIVFMNQTLARRATALKSSKHRLSAVLLSECSALDNLPLSDIRDIYNSIKPERDTRVANRLIGAALGIRIPPKNNTPKPLVVTTAPLQADSSQTTEPSIV